MLKSTGILAFDVMRNIIEDFPVTTTLVLVGIAIGLLAPSPFQDFITNLSFENVTQNPTETLTGWVIGFPVAMIGETVIKIISGLIGGLIGAIIGIFIDGRRKSEGYY